MSSCALDGCNDPTCGPCTIYARFPDLQALDVAQAQHRLERQMKNPARGGQVDLPAQGERAAKSRKRRGPKDMR